jgi:hypothetical protein
MMLPGFIADAARRINGYNGIRGQEELLKQRKLDLQYEAGRECDDAGERLYTNAPGREGRAIELAKSDEEYKRISDTIAELKTKQRDAEIYADRLRNELTARKIAAIALTEMLRGENIKQSVETQKVIVEVNHVAR